MRGGGIPGTPIFFETLEEGGGDGWMVKQQANGTRPKVPHFGSGADPDQRSTIIKMLNLSRYPNRRVSKHVFAWKAGWGGMRPYGIGEDTQ